LLNSFSPLCPSALPLKVAIFLLLWSCSAHASNNALVLVDLSLEELANLRVTSVSRRPVPVATTAASIYVITGEDIRRTGVTSLPEALRLAPNLQVARVDARNYAITARGFNNAFANKLLVLIDGRTVYSPLFSGVFWDAQDLVLEDVERIEVISGPGATLWGANAVNGVINITTRPAAQTQGTLLSGGASMLEHQLVARTGFTVGEAGHMRVYAKHAAHDDVKNAAGGFTHTGWYRTQMGFRGDLERRENRFTLQGDAYSGRLQQLGTEDIAIAGVNLVGRVKQQLGLGSELMGQVYFDHSQRDQPLRFEEHLNTFDMDLQHSVDLGRRHKLVWGGGYRHAHDNVENDQAFEFLPEHFPMNWANVFAQNDISIFRATRFTLGLKMERNPYTGWEFLPNLRLAWTPRDERGLVWGAVSRSVRSPSRIDRDLFAPADPQDGSEHQYFIGGGPDFVSEIADVAELGYKARPLPEFNYSMTIFYANYHRLRTLESGVVGSPSEFANKASANSFGMEFWTQWQAAPRWRLGAGLVLQQIDVDLDPDSRDQSGGTGLANGDPEIYWQMRSSLDLKKNTQFEAFLRHVGELGAEQTRTPAYSALDMRWGWRPIPGLELSLVGQNLLDDSHPEFGTAPGYAEFRRALYTKLLWEF
jgi:iron complex outermembrane receptor protein